MMKRLVLSMIFTVMAAVSIIPAKQVDAAKTICTTYEGSNIEAQNYSRWSSPIESYLTATADGMLMRVQAGMKEGYLVEYYDREYNLDIERSKVIPQELPIFGGFYESNSNYYLVTGQLNHEESAEVEVYRITKYDKSWKKISSRGLKNCNTTVPFDAGSCRMDMDGDYLVIRTCHEMYRSSDGRNHQSNVTIQLDTRTMTITDSYTGIMNSEYGYISHSFNQFVKVDEGRIAAVDHGDAHPRSIALLKYPRNISSGKFVPDYSNRCQVIDVMQFPGATGDNSTGASIGGFEITDRSYLITGNSVVQDGNNTKSKTRNIFVSSVNKQTAEISIHWLTDYAEGDGTTSTPQFVKVSADRYMVLWSRNKKVYYTQCDESGNKVTDIYSLSGSLSDCVPIVVDHKLIWYAWKDGWNTFYEISLDDLSKQNIVEIQNGHHFEVKRVEKETGMITRQCAECGLEDTVQGPKCLKLYWKAGDDNGYTYSSIAPAEELREGKTLNYWAYPDPENADGSVQVTSSNPEVATVEPTTENMGNIQLHAAGKVTITFTSKINPEIKEEVELKVKGKVRVKRFFADSESPQKVGAAITLTTETYGGIGSVQYRYYLKNADGTETVLQDYSEEPTYLWKPAYIGKKEICVDVKDEENVVCSGSIKDFAITKGKTPTAPAEQINVSYSKELVSDIELPEGWSWKKESAGKTLEVDTLQEAVAEYKDQVNYEDAVRIVRIIRSFCEHEEGERIIDREASCEQPGVGHTECIRCKEVVQGEIIIPQLEHAWDDGVISKEASCVESGIKTYTCRLCKGQNTISITKLPHTPGALTIRQAATCVQSGIGFIACVNCKKILQDQIEIPKLAANMALPVMEKLTIPMKTGQSTGGLSVTGLGVGDSVVSWQSSDPKVVSVIGNADGTSKVKAGKKAGTATIAITLASGIKQVVTVKVSKAKVKTKKITGLKKSITLKKKESLGLQPVPVPFTSQEKITYKSSNKKVVTVSSKGIIKGKKKGKARITVRSGKKKFTIKIQVK